MAAKHTPGPWKLKFWSENVGVSSDRPKPRDCESIALVARGLETGVDSLIRQTADANAHLIAAAPDLLAACEATLKMLDSNADENGPDRWLLLRNAITKARGGA